MLYVLFLCTLIGKPYENRAGERCRDEKRKNKKIILKIYRNNGYRKKILCTRLFGGFRGRVVIYILIRERGGKQKEKKIYKSDHFQPTSQSCAKEGFGVFFFFFL